MFPLTTINEGEEIEFNCFSCSCEDACKLRDLGCIEGGKGRILKKNRHIILQIGESRLAIDHSLANSIFVSPRLN